MEALLAPALAPVDAPGLQVFCEMAGSSGADGAVLERLDSLAEAAAVADPENAAVAKARAQLLGDLDCCYLGCS